MGFGDSGKGLVTDWLCSQTKNPLVVRFCGGHQAGHTVVKDGIRHVFSSFGSGTLRGIPTYWSRFCTVDPLALLKELNVLLSKGVKPTLYIDAKCPITTTYDVWANQDKEKTYRHGSVGVGFGATLEREERYYSLLFRDLFYPSILKEKLYQIGRYYRGLDKCLMTPDGFLDTCNKVINSDYIKPTNGLFNTLYNNLIFEGSQGLLLDKHFGFFPHVTRADLGTKNILKLMGGSNNLANAQFYLVTRAYQTRHGNGFMTNEDLKHDIKLDPNETNVENEWQGKFRRSMLDVSLLEYAINSDKNIRYSPNKNLVITCLDHLSEYKFTYQDEVIESSSEREFVSKIADILEIRSVFLSHSPEGKNIERLAC